MDGHGIGVWIDISGTAGFAQVMVSPTLYVALQTCLWIGAVVAGLVSAWLVLP